MSAADPVNNVRSLLRADLHVHSYHSGHARHLRSCGRAIASDRGRVRAAKARGMDLVTITDHDSIDGCLEFLDRHPAADDFFVSEEIECLFPGVPLKAHVAVYGIDERIHREIQPLRSNVHDVVACLRQHDVFFALNHLFFFFERQMPLERYLAAVLPLFPAFETRNGAMLPDHNRLIEEVVPAGVTALGGSDAHTLAFVGTTYTEAPGPLARISCEACAPGRALPSVAGRAARARRQEIYGVVFRYWASLAGVAARSCRGRAAASGWGSRRSPCPSNSFRAGRRRSTRPASGAASRRIGENSEEMDVAQAPAARVKP